MNENEVLDNLEIGIEDNDVFFEPSKGKRLANYFIDMFTYLILAILLGTVIALFDEFNGGDNIIVDYLNSEDSPIFDNIIGFVLVVGYYTFTEYVYKGKTLGKLITKTRAVTQDNKRLTLKHAFLRSLCRIIPFEGISYLGSSTQGLHDKLPKTKVIIDEGWNEY
jgi:uncharacterized RDD family membrane protein YckC